MLVIDPTTPVNTTIYGSLEQTHFYFAYRSRISHHHVIFEVSLGSQLFK